MALEHQVGRLALMIEHLIELVVSKDSGGAATAPKLAAARELGLPVLLIDRPEPPPGLERVSTVDAAARWVVARRDRPTIT